MTYTYNLEEDVHDAYTDSDGKPVLTWDRRYLLESDSATFTGTYAARLGFQQVSNIIPGVGFIDYAQATCKHVKVSSLETKAPNQKWRVEVNWSTETRLIDDPNPANRRYTRKVTTSEQQRFVFRDQNDELIVDAAGSPFDGGVPVNVRLATITWEHNVDFSNYDLGRTTQLSGCLNLDNFLGCDPKTLMIDVVGEEQWEGIYHFVHETITITYDPLGWQPKPANAGLFYLDPLETDPDKKRKRIKINGQDAVEPEPLYGDDAGSLIGTVVPEQNRPDDCNFIEVDYYRTIPFAALNLPLN